jgi:hypothetical protein
VAFAPASRITHQKTVCTDDDSCLIMSLNLVSDDYASTRDVAVQDSDPRDVAAIESTFDADFTGGTAPATSGGDHLLWSPGSESGIVGVINGARHSPWRWRMRRWTRPSSPHALAAAARRGVDVDSLHDGRQLLHTGARPDRRRRWSRFGCIPISDGVLYIHEKLILADVGTPSATAVVGSINFSTSSLDYNRELDIVLSEQDDAPANSRRSNAPFRATLPGRPPCRNVQSSAVRDLVLGRHGRHSSHRVAGIEAHEPDAGGVATLGGDLAHGRPDDDATGGDEQDLVVEPGHEGTHHAASHGGELYGPHSLAAAALYGRSGRSWSACRSRRRSR